MGSAPADTPANGTAVARIDDATAQHQQRTQNAIVLGGQPRYSLAELMELSRVMAVANLVPEPLRGKPSDVLITIMKGQDLGLSPTQAIDAIPVIKGKATVGVHLAVALARQRGHKVEVSESDGSCTVTITRCDSPNPIAVTFTIEMAKRAGIRNALYETDPQSMLYARAATRCVRRACPEVLLGLYVEGELDGSGPDQQPPAVAAAGPALALAPVAAKRATAERADQQPDAALAEQVQEDAEQAVEQAADDAADAGPTQAEIDAARAADYADIEAEHNAEYGTEPQTGFDFGTGDK